MSDLRPGRSPLRTQAGRPTPAGLVADGLRRRRDARQAVVRVHEADGLARTLDLAAPAAEALRRAAARCVEAVADGAG